MRWSYLGRVPYRQALDLQLRLREAILARRAPDTLLLLEHPPVITLGRSARPENVLVDAQERRRRGVELVRVERGGDVTYHGPGQLVGYPIRQIGRRVAEHVEEMVAALMTLLARHGIASHWESGRPGLWTDRGKIAAVGVDARGGVAIHGFALNVSPELSQFEMINPCGLAGAPVSSIAAAVGDAPPLVELARELAVILSRRWYATDGAQVAPERIEEGLS